MHYLRLSLITLALMLPACAFTLLKSAMDKNENLSPEQIRAYNEVGLDVFACFEVSGPPPTGSVVFLLWPKTKDPGASFGPNCQIVRGAGAQESRPFFQLRPGAVMYDDLIPRYPVYTSRP